MEGLRDRVLSEIGPVSPTPSRVPLISSVTGALVDPSVLTSEYWFDNLRLPVRLDAAVRTAAARKHRVFVEVSPHPVLGVAMLSILEDAGHGARTHSPAVVLGSLHRGEGDAADWLRSLGGAHCAGLDVRWDGLPSVGHVDLPVYPFQHTRFWYDPPRPAPASGETSDLRNEPDVPGPTNDAAELRARLTRLDPSLAQRQVTTMVLAALADALGHESAAQLSPDRSFLDLGVGSLAAVAVRTRLADLTGLTLAVTVVFDHPNPAALAEFLAAEIVAGGADPVEEPVIDEPFARPLDERSDLTDVTDDEMFAALDRELGMT